MRVLYYSQSKNINRSMEEYLKAVIPDSEIISARERSTALYHAESLDAVVISQEFRNNRYTVNSAIKLARELREHGFEGKLIFEYVIRPKKAAIFDTMVPIGKDWPKNLEMTINNP